MRIPFWKLSLVLAATSMLLAACGRSPAAAPASQSSTASGGSSAAAEAPLPAAQGSGGDIPDTQVFITFRSAAGKYSVEAPEGWARTENGADVKFTDHFDGEQVNLLASASAPTPDSVQREPVSAIRKSGRAVTIEGVKSITLANGTPVISITYSSNSEPDPVTGKQVRLSDVTALFYRQGKLAALALWAPRGTDNVDQWKRITESFRWQ
jgi:hypothetical protein